MYGALNEFLFSLPVGANAAFVDLYAPSTITFPVARIGATVNFTVVTQWPYGTDVEVLVSTQPPVTAKLDLALRVPAWLAADSMPVLLNGAPAAQGQPGSYLHVAVPQSLPDVQKLTFSLPMAFVAHFYSGDTQIRPYNRWGYTYGPILLACVGPWDSTLNAVTLPLSIAEPSEPDSWLLPTEQPLHFVVNGLPDHVFIPYGEVPSGVLFSVYPVFV